MNFKISVLFVLLIASLQKSVCQEGLTNKEIARFYFEEVVNKQRLDLLNKVFADTFLVHILGDSTNNRSTIATQRSFLQYLFKAFPDIQYRVGDIIEERDKVAIRVTLSASHKNEFWGRLPAGNKVNYLSEIFFFQFQNSKVVESWVQIDLYNLFKQLDGKK